MTYDRNGRRIEYVEAISNLVFNTCVTNLHQRFVYDGYLCLQRLNAAVSNAVTDLFEWDPTEPIAARPLYWQRREAAGNYSLFYTHDGNKNVSEVVFYQRARGVAAHYGYAPFGEVTIQTGGHDSGSFDFTALNPWQFSSEYCDICGLDYYLFRYCDPIYGRWISCDYIESCKTVSLYGFCNNAPIYCFDWKGLSCVRIASTNECEYLTIDEIKDGALARTDFEFEVFVSCQCNEILGGWILNNYDVVAYPKILYRPFYESNFLKVHARKNELDHIDDIIKWINGDLSIDISVWKVTNSFVLYDTERLCVSRNRELLTSVIANGYTQAANESRIRWDVSQKP